MKNILFAAMASVAACMAFADAEYAPFGRGSVDNGGAAAPSVVVAPAPLPVVPVSPINLSAPVATAVVADPVVLEETTSPFALTVGPLSVPPLDNCSVYGVRVNLSFPNIGAKPVDMFGIDLGLFGECDRDAGGLAVNVLGNKSESFSGIAIGGFVNRTKELNGLQIGILNIAECGMGLQIGLWNKSGSGRQSPILGFVF